MGRRPVKYRVYGSDEKGFSVSDEPYKVDLGVSNKETAPVPVGPANFIAETTAPSCPSWGAGQLPRPIGPTTAWWRWTSRKSSGPSDYAAGPRPVIYTKPRRRPRSGELYQYQAASTAASAI